MTRCTTHIRGFAEEVSQTGDVRIANVWFTTKTPVTPGDFVDAKLEWDGLSWLAASLDVFPGPKVSTPAASQPVRTETVAQNRPPVQAHPVESATRTTNVASLPLRPSPTQPAPTSQPATQPAAQPRQTPAASTGMDRFAAFGRSSSAGNRPAVARAPAVANSRPAFQPDTLSDEDIPF